MRFRFLAKNSKGKKIRGKLEAISLEDATSQLRGNGYEIIQILEMKSRRSNLFGNKIKPVELVNFSHQLAVMFQSGVPIRRALQVQTLHVFSEAFSGAVSKLELDVSEGRSISEAMERQGEIFDPWFVGMIQMGEQSGSLESVLFRLSKMIERSVQTQRKIGQALVYPITVFVLAFLFCLGVVQHILPVFFNGVFADESLELPAMTQVLVWVTDFFSDPVNLGLLAGGGAIGAFLLGAYFRTPTGRFQLQSMTLSIPYLKSLRLAILSSRFTRLFGSMMSSGMPILRALKLCKVGIGDMLAEQALDRVIARIEAGSELSEAVDDTDFFPKIVTEFIKAGEESGRTVELLERLADIFDEEVDLTITNFLSLLEPLMLLIMGLLVGYVVLALIIPLYQFAGNI